MILTDVRPELPYLAYNMGRQTISDVLIRPPAISPKHTIISASGLQGDGNRTSVPIFITLAPGRNW